MGFDSEKLLTLEETARRLGVPADDVEVMIREGRLPAFRLGGHLLRVRLKDADTLRQTPRPSPSASSSWRERISDFLYFNDFYLVALLILLTLLAIILTL